MTKNIKHYIAVAIIFGLMAFRIGIIEGAVDYHPASANTPIKLANAALESGRPVAFTKLTDPIHITAYSSRPEETDSTPFITASGTRVRDGVVAANWLPIGTKIRIPSLFGDKVFTVEDRMARKNSHKLDIWFAETSQAFKFGVKFARVEIL